MVQLIDLPAGNLEQPVSFVNKTFGQPQHSTDHHLRHVIWINILGEYVGWPHMCCGVLSMSPNQQTALLPNSPLDLESQNYQKYIGPEWEFLWE